MIKLPAHEYLDQHNIPYERRSFPADTPKGAASVAQVFGFRERQMVKTLIFTAKSGETALVMLGGDQNAISGNLKKILSSRDIRLAKPAVVQAVTGYAIGSIPPFGWQPPAFRSFLEASLLDEPLLGVGAGQWGEEILLTPAQLVTASEATIVNLTERNQPVFCKLSA